MCSAVTTALILDEPTAVLTEGEAQRLLTTVREIAERGAAVILVTHKLRDVRDTRIALPLCAAARPFTTHDAQATTAEELTMLTVGSKVVTPSWSSKPAGEPSLVVTGLAGDTIEGHSPLVDASFAVRAGEIFGVAGVGRNGQTGLAAALVGGRLPSAGTIAIKDTARNALIDITILADAARAPRHRGVAAVPADRQSFGLASSLSIVDNYAIGFIHEGKFGSPAWIDRATMVRATEAAIAEFEVQGVRSLRQPGAALLSGGNAQKLIAAS